MVKIEWNDLPLALRDHLFDRAAERKITADDLYRLKLWRESEPNAPEGPWFKDFGSFKISTVREGPNASEAIYLEQWPEQLASRILR
jgi:hypothetical protein